MNLFWKNSYSSKIKRLEHSEMYTSKLLIFFVWVGVSLFSWGSPKIVVVPGDYNIALTFDDGPDSLYTSQILDILEQEQIKGTFFLIGKQMKRHPDITKRIHQQGHCIGNHTYNHCCVPRMSFEDILHEVTTTDHLIDSLCGPSCKFFRAPWGAISADQAGCLNDLGYTVFGWDLDSDDWNVQNNSVNSIVTRVTSRISPGKIVLFHSADYAGKDGREKTIAALPLIIHTLKQWGYRFVTLKELKPAKKSR